MNPFDPEPLELATDIINFVPGFMLLLISATLITYGLYKLSTAKSEDEEE